MATYKKNMIMRALSFWKTKLDESKKETVESEEDQKKEAAKEQADEEQAEIDAADEGTGDAGEDAVGDEELGFDPDADFDQAMDDDGSGEGDAEDDTGSDTADETGDDASEGEDDAGDDESGDDGEDAGEDEEDSAEEAAEGDDEDDGEDAGDDEGESEFRLEITAPSKKLLDAIPDLCKKFGSKVSVTVAGLDPEGDDEEGGYVTAIECQDEETLNAVKEEDAVKEAVGGMDGELNESLQYEPNTVGAVVKLLGKSDPRDFLFIRLAPNMKQCMIYDIDRKVMAEGQSTTYLEIAIGDPNK